MPIVNGYAAEAELADHLGIEYGGDGDAMERAINAASRAIDEHCRRRFWVDAAATSVTYQATHPYRLYARDISSASGLIVKTDDGDNGTYGTTWAITTDFVLQQWQKDRAGSAYHMIQAVGGRTFPTAGRRERVQVTALHGWTAVPAEVVQATLLKAARVFRRKDSPEGIAGGVEFGAVRISRFEDPDVTQLLSPLVRGGGMIL